MKCGGTSLRRALRDVADGDLFELDGSAAMAATGGILAQAENWRFRKDLLSYVLHAGPPAVTLGHWRFDDTGHIPLLDRAAFVTLLRPPVDRLVSLYRYRKHGARDGLPVHAPLAETLRDPGWQQAGCHVVETFCGRADLDPRSDEAVEAALANLDRFAVVGTLADLPRFADALADTVGRPVAIGHHNPSPAPPGVDEDAEPDESAALDALLAEICAPDQRVYDALFGP